VSIYPRDKTFKAVKIAIAEELECTVADILCLKEKDTGSSVKKDHHVKNLAQGTEIEYTLRNAE